MRTLLAVIALLALPACTPEEEAAVIADYAARMNAEAGERDSDGPTWSVVADCGGAQVTLTGWTGVTDVSPSTGARYVLVGLGGSPPFGVELDESGSVDRYIPADLGTAGVAAWPWSLIINGEPGLREFGVAIC